MDFIRDQKSDVEPNLDSASAGDLPPAYDALSIHQSPNHNANRSSAFPGPDAGPSSGLSGLDSARLNPPVLNIDKSLPSCPSSDNNTPSSPRNASPALAQRPRARKNTAWLSHLPFVSSFSAKRVRQSVLSVVSDLVVPPSRVGSGEQKNVYELFASIAETCAEHRLSLSTILQETSIAGHTPMYWAVVNYRQELLLALLVHSRPLSIPTISDIRRACLVSSNQALFHALRVRRPPFHRTDGIQVPSLRAASDNLLLGHRPLDEIRIQQTSDQVFVVSFDILLWQRRMKAIGRVGIEFIASGRMWSVTFFSTDPSSPIAMSGKSRKGTNTWHVMVNILESSPPTFFDSQLVVDVPPLVSKSIQIPRLREARSTPFLPSRDKQDKSRSSMNDYNSDREAYLRRGSLSSPRSSTAIPSSVSIRLGSGNRKLAHRTGSGDSSKSSETPTTRPDTWSDHGVGYTNAVVSPLGEGFTSQLLNESVIVHLSISCFSMMHRQSLTVSIPRWYAERTVGGETCKVRVIQGLYHLLELHVALAGMKISMSAIWL
ncbi:hypothetical protein J3R83DRAFT_2264 [Lanmaoa asiatica]|nr:hypothetical protein J3R83DRAFT_2264 [Lanmaoa asiatica]